MAQGNTFSVLSSKKYNVQRIFHILNHTLYTILTNFYLFFTAAETNALNKGCGVATVLLYSG